MLPADRGGVERGADRLVELGDLDRLGDVAVHAGGEVLVDLVGQALAVSATIGVRRRPPPASTARISRAAAMPSITGIWMSIRIRS